jgi:plastocyanin
MTNWIRVLVPVAVATLAQSACNNNSGTVASDLSISAMDLTSPSDMTGGAGDMSGPQVHVVMVGTGGIAFSPSDLTVKAGDTVQWHWATSGHTVTSGSGCTADNTFCSPNSSNCASASTSNSGFIYSTTFNVPGTFPYFCIPHCRSGMTGSITVQ